MNPNTRITVTRRGESVEWPVEPDSRVYDLYIDHELEAQHRSRARVRYEPPKPRYFKKAPEENRRARKASFKIPNPKVRSATPNLKKLSRAIRKAAGKAQVRRARGALNAAKVVLRGETPIHGLRKGIAKAKAAGKYAGHWLKPQWDMMWSAKHGKWVFVINTNRAEK